MKSNVQSRMDWYIEHRLEMLRLRREALKARLDPDANADVPVDYEALREFMEITGRVRELEELREHVDRW